MAQLQHTSPHDPATCSACRADDQAAAIANGMAATITTPDTRHLLTVFNGVDVPDDVAHAVMRLLAPYDPDVYVRDCDATGRAL